MFDKDNELKAFALNLWANYIETDSVILSSRDNVKLKKLADDQIKFVQRLRDLAKSELTSKE